ncbi:hypothetical protein IMCC26134_09920 [Verrucomicrobia bacterium IMCC26134]|nr:hypothetical protein IMCC26134_09920 [Verrucomicrobia bacterium IMCC26134]
MKLLTKLSSLATGLLLCAGLTRAEPVETTTYGDLILGIYATGGTGSGFTLSVNLGEFTKFATLDGTSFTVNELSRNDLNTFGTGANFSRTNVNWGVVGTAGTLSYTSEGTGLITPRNTLFATAPVDTTLNNGSTNAQVGAISAIGGVYTGLANATATVNSPSATTGSSANGDSWYSLQTLNLPLDFGFFTSSVITSTNVATLNLYELVPTNASAAALTEVGIVKGINLLGSFNLANTGVLTYTAASSIVTKTPQTITFATLPAKNYGDAAITLSATASSGLAPTYSLVSGPATLSGATLTLTGVGTVIVRASQAGDTTYDAATPVERSFTVAQAAQTITFAPLANKTFGDAAFALSASSTSSLTPTFTVVSGPAILSGSTLTLTGAGTVTIRASQVGDANYAAATPVERTLTVDPSGQSLTFAPLANKTFGDAAFVLSASSTSSLTPTFTVVSGPATLSGSTLTLTGAGTVTIRASQVGDANYAAATPVERSFTVAASAQTLTFAPLANKTFGDAAFAVSASSTSSLTPTFTVVSGPATLSGSTLTLTGAGTVTVRASQSGDTNYAAATPVERSFTVSASAQTLTFAPLANKTFGDAAFALSASSTSSLTPTFTVVSGPATLSGSTLTLSGAGSVTVRASQTGDANYAAATPVERSFTVAQASQTLTFAPLADKTFGDAAFALSASSTSSLTPTFTVVSGPATLSGSTLTLSGAGSVTVRASQAGDASYAAATPVERSFKVAQASQTLTFAPLADKTFGDAAFALSASSTSSLTPTFTVVSGPATLSGSTLTLTGAGPVTVRASQAGDTSYAAATPVERSFNVAQASQTLTFAPLADNTFGDAAFALSASSTSSLTPTFTVVSGPATLSGSTLTLTGAGPVTVRASQAGDTNYAAATPVDRSFSVSKSAQTITFAPLVDKAFGDAAFALSASSTSSLTPTFTVVSGPATLSGSTLTLTGAGPVTVRASQAGDANYAAATPVERSFAVSASGSATQTITFGALANKTFGDPTVSLVATSDSGLPPSFSIVSGPATILGSSLTITGAGTVTVRADQGGNDLYAAAASVDHSFAVAQAPQTLTFAAPANMTYGDPDFELVASASSSLAPAFSLISGPATLSGAILTLTGAGTVTVRAEQTGNTNYSAAIAVERSFSAGPASQTLTFAPLANKTFGDAAFALTASSSSELPPSFTIVSGPATLAGATVTLTGVGAVTIRASQTGNANYTAAAPIERTFNVAEFVKSPQTITFATVTGKSFGDPTFTLSASASSGLPLAFTLVSGPATLFGSSLTITGAGTIIVRAEQAGDATYSTAVPVERSIDVAKATQALTFASLANKTFGDAAFALSASSTSSLTPTFTVISGPATLSGSTLTLTGAGTVTVRAEQSGDTNYTAATPIERTLTVDPSGQSLTFAPLVDKTFGDAAFALSASSTSSLTPTFTVISGPATLSGSTLTLSGAGTVTVRASQAGDTNYGAATPVERSFTAAQAAQTLTFAPLADKAFGDAAFALSASSTSSLTPTFTVVSGPATLSGSTLTLSGAGTVTVRASQAGDTNYAAATPVERSFTAAQAAQTLTFAPLVDKAFGDAAFALSASSTSSLTPTFTIVSGPATLSGSSLSITGTGTVTVRAAQAGDANYSAASPVDQSFNVGQASQTISFAALSNKTFGDDAFTLIASSTSGLTPTFSAISGPATLSGSTLTLTGAGTVVVRAAQTGDANYYAATPVERSFIVAQASQTITFAPLANKTFGDAAFALSASATSGLAPIFTVVSGSATLSGSTLTLTGAGTVVVRAAQTGDANYSAATPVERSFTVAKTSQTLTFAPLVDKAFGDAAFVLSAFSTSSLTPTFTVVSGPATLSGSTLTLTGAGPITVRASQAGDTNYAAATPVERTFTVTPPQPALISDQVQPTGSVVNLSLALPNAPAGLSYHASGLPSGLDLNPDTGAISGTLTAIPDKYTVTHWFMVGDTQSPLGTFSWTVEPFPSALTGRFEGLFVAPSSVALPVAKIELTVANTGAFTGRLTHGTPGVATLTGQLALDPSGNSATLATLSAEAYTLQSLKVSSASGISATLVKNAAVIGKLIDGVRLAAYDTPNPAPWIGTYTSTFTAGANFDPAVIDRAAPLGSGYATGSVGANGALSLAGKLADGTAFTGSFNTDANAGYRLFLQPHGTANNYLSGWIKLTRWSTTPVDRYYVTAAEGQDFYWNKPAMATDVNYRAGFGPMALRVRLATWIAPDARQTLAALLDLTTTNASKLSLKTTGNSLSATQRNALTATVKLNPTNTLTVSGTTQSKLWTPLTLNVTSGQLSGSVKVQDTRFLSRSAAWEGVMLQSPSADRGKIIGQGFYLLAPVARPSTSALGCGVTLTTP